MRTESHLKHSNFQPARGGHAPGDLREAFEEALDAWEAMGDQDPLPTVKLRGQDVSIVELCGLLWNCTDIMPSLMCQTFESCGVNDVPHGSTYAVGARAYKALAEAENLLD